MTQKTPLISATLYIEGDDFDAEELTHIVNVLPTKIWKRKEIEALNAYPNIPKLGWHYKISRQPSWEINEIVTQLLAIFYPSLNRLNEFINAYKLKVTVGCYVRCYGDNPVLKLSAENVKLLADLNAIFSIDMGNDDKSGLDDDSEGKSDRPNVNR